jgi:hypothetical protein
MDERLREERRLLRRRVAISGAGMAQLRAEVDRSRRHAHALALVRLPAAGARDLERARRAVAARVRTVDVVWTDARGVLVLLPECDRDGADGLLARLRAAVAPVVALDAIRVACFPADGLTADALYAAVAGARRAAPAQGEPLREPLLKTAD